MIVSASRRTDLPACYPEWLLSRLREGFVRVKNPMNPAQSRVVSLRPEDVGGLVLWTKDFAPLMGCLGALRDYNWYVQFTITSYGRDVEPNLPRKARLIETFRRLSDEIGPRRVLWRYDPILLSPRYTPEYHEKYFEALAGRLAGWTEQCTISFVDWYPRIRSAMRALEAEELSAERMRDVAKRMATVAKRYELKLVTCAEEIDLSEFGIGHGRCVDAERLSELAGRLIGAPADRNQRKSCGCAQSVDIGEYTTCLNGCRYCYAQR